MNNRDEYLKNLKTQLLKGASADAWQEIARGADEARKTMQDAFEKARFHFRDVQPAQTGGGSRRVRTLLRRKFPADFTA